MYLYAVFLFLLGCFIFKILLNAKNWYFLNKYKNLHKDYLGADNEEAQNKFGWEINKKTPEIVKLFKNAGLKDTYFSFMENVGFGHAKENALGIFDNLACLDSVGHNSLPIKVVKYFTKGLGIYEMRLKEAFSPFYWVNVILFLPQEIVTYLGISFEGKQAKFIVRLLNFLYWVFIAICKVLPSLHHHLILLMS